MKTYFGLTKKEIKRKYKTKKFLNEIEGFIALLSIVIILFTSVTIYKEAINLIRDYKESEKIIEEHFNKSDAGAVSASMEVSLDGIGDTFSPSGDNSLSPSVKEIVDIVFALESSRGKNDSCRNFGMYNGYGYGVENDRVASCYETHEEVSEIVSRWFENNLKTKTLAESLCYYNTGISINNCEYYDNFKNLISK